MKRSARRLLLAVVLVLVSSTSGFAQGASQSLSGVVVDAAGGVIPGASVVVLNKATGEKFELTSNEAGAFAVPGIAVGTYTVTVTLQSFKTAVINDVRIVTGTAANVRATMELGALSETVQVSSRAELVQSQSPSVASTLVAEQLNEVPLASRNALYALNMLPGVQYGSGAGPRAAGINGLPNNTVNITIDGVQTGKMLQSTDGFFSMVTPRLDAVEEVTVTGATPTADQAALGAVQVSFVTRSGTNNFDGSLYHYFRYPELNSNYYFNKIRGLERNDVVVHQYGGRVGGPIVIPGLFDGRNKAFFFFNMEEFYQPTEASRTRTILHPRAQEGWFRYNVTVGGVQQVREINLLTLAQQNTQLATLDPITGGLLANIRAAAGTAGTITELTNPNTQQYFYQSAGTNRQHAPTGRVDINVSQNHRLSGSYSWGRLVTEPDILNNNDSPFPGFPNFGRSPSYRTVGSTSLRSTLSSNLVNDLRGGWQWSPLEFSTNVTPDMFDQQGGFGWSFTAANMFGLTSPGNLTGLEDRNTTNWNIDNTLSWLRGTHSLTFGGSFMQVNHARTVWSAVPQITFGTDANFDPANAMFSTANLPGASTQNITDARALYGLLTGRLTAINGTARLGEASNRYEYLGPRTERVRLNEMGLFAQDSWRFTPTLTLNYGVRWELQLPMEPLNDSFSMSGFSDLCGRSGTGSGPGGRGCNIFQPGTLTGSTPQYVQYDSGNPGYDTDWNNFAPNVGAAWRPNVQDGWLRALLGDPDQATIRAGYAVAFTRERMDRFTNLYSANPGAAINANRTGNQGNLVLPGESWPITLSQQNRLGPPTFPDSPSYPLTPSWAAKKSVPLMLMRSVGRR